MTDDEQYRASCFHESGHLVAAAVFGYSCEAMARKGKDGRCTILNTNRGEGSDTVHGCAILASFFAGCVGEHVLNGDFGELTTDSVYEEVMRDSTDPDYPFAVDRNCVRALIDRGEVTEELVKEILEVAWKVYARPEFAAFVTDVGNLLECCGGAIAVKSNDEVIVLGREVEITGEVMTVLQTIYDIPTFRNLAATPIFRWQRIKQTGRHA